MKASPCWSYKNNLSRSTAILSHSSVALSGVTSMKSPEEKLWYWSELTQLLSLLSFILPQMQSVSQCYSSATQINSLAPTPDSSFTQECLFCVFSSSGHAQFTLYAAVGEKTQTRQCNNNSLLLSFTFPLSVSLSSFLLLIWRHCRGWRGCLFVHSECNGNGFDGRFSQGWHIYTYPARFWKINISIHHIWVDFAPRQGVFKFKGMLDKFRFKKKKRKMADCFPDRAMIATHAATC